jgi:hypothetical protein
MKNTIVETSRAALKKEGYYTDNLWHVNDVTNLYNCTDEQAMNILNRVMQSEAVIEYIFDSIKAEVDSNINLITNK